MSDTIRKGIGRRQFIGAAAAMVAVPGAVAAAIAAPARQGQQPVTSITLKTTNDLKFVPNEFTIPVNTDVEVTLDNSAGALPHNFSVDDHNQKPGLPNLKVKMNVAPGKTAKGTVNAPQPGDYYFYCNVPGHEAAGMYGTMHVVAAGGQGAASATPGGTPEGTPAAAGGGASNDVTINCIDINFDPKQLTIPANTDVTVHVVNKGALQHNWVVTDAPNGEKIGTKLLNSGDTEDVKVNLPAGTYNFECTVPGHAAAGMVGKLVVQ